MSYRMVCDFCQVAFGPIDSVEELTHREKNRKAWDWRNSRVTTWHVHAHCLRTFKGAMKEAYHGETVIDKPPAPKQKNLPAGWPKNFPPPPRNL